MRGSVNGGHEGGDQERNETSIINSRSVGDKENHTDRQLYENNERVILYNKKMLTQMKNKNSAFCLGNDLKRIDSKQEESNLKKTSVNGVFAMVKTDSNDDEF